MLILLKLTVMAASTTLESVSEAEVTRSRRKYLSHTHSDEITPIAPVTGTDITMVTILTPKLSAC